jgi:hypothetical protein
MLTFSLGLMVMSLEQHPMMKVRILPREFFFVFLKDIFSSENQPDISGIFSGFSI